MGLKFLVLRTKAVTPANPKLRGFEDEFAGGSMQFDFTGVAEPPQTPVNAATGLPAVRPFSVGRLQGRPPRLSSVAFPVLLSPFQFRAEGRAQPHPRPLVNDRTEHREEPESVRTARDGVGVSQGGFVAANANVVLGFIFSPSGLPRVKRHTAQSKRTGIDRAVQCHPR